MKKPWTKYNIPPADLHRLTSIPGLNPAITRPEYQLTRAYLLVHKAAIMDPEALVYGVARLHIYSKPGEDTAYAVFTTRGSLHRDLHGAASGRSCPATPPALRNTVAAYQAIENAGAELFITPAGPDGADTEDALYAVGKGWGYAAKDLQVLAIYV